MALSARLKRATHWLTASCSTNWTTREYGATKWYRTTDAKFFKLPLYQLSYRSMVLPIRIEQIFIVYKTIVLTIILKEQFHKTLIYLQIIFKTNLDNICCLCLFMLSRLSILLFQINIQIVHLLSEPILLTNYGADGMNRTFDSCSQNTGFTTKLHPHGRAYR